MRKYLVICLILALFLTGCSKGKENHREVLSEILQTQETDAPEKPTEESVEQTTEATTEATEPPIPENPYGPMDFGYEGEYLTCLAGESMVGIDVSYWQGDIDWQQVADSGVEFAIIRLAWRGSEQGLLFADEYAQTNYEKAIAAGIKVGGYFFSQAITPEEAAEEAQYALDMVKDWQIEMPIIFDWEHMQDSYRTNGMDAKTLTACTKAFCDTILAAGYETMVYFNPEQAWRKLNLEELTDYGFWLAMYESTMVYPYRVHMWQYTDAGTVPGIAGNVDLNVYLSYE